MRGIGLVALLIAGAATACRSPSLVGRPNALGPSVIIGYTIESNVEVPETPPEARSPMGRTASLTPAVDRTNRASADRTGRTTGPTADAADTNAVPTTVPLPSARVPVTGSSESGTDRPSGEAQVGTVGTTSAPTTPATSKSIESDAARPRTSASPWPWVALAVLLVAAVVVVRRLRTRSRKPSHRFDADDAWDVFQAGLARKPGEQA